MSLSLVCVDSYDILNNFQAQFDKYGDDISGQGANVPGIYIPGVGGIGTAFETQFDGGRDSQTFVEWAIHPYSVTSAPTPSAWMIHFDFAAFYPTSGGPGASSAAPMW